ncbi:MAG: hypothetical protein CME32_00865 [Gimesia sp.]|nr:hypothetical protein [Gimesia sp.]
MKLIALPLSIGLAVLLAKLLDVESYGKYAFIISLSTALALPAGQGIRELVLREVALAVTSGDSVRINEVWRISFRFYAVCNAVTLAILMILCVSSWALNAATDYQEVVIYSLILIPLVSVISLHAGVLQGLGRVADSQLSPVLLRPLLSFLFVAASIPFFWNYSLASAFGMHLAATVVSVVVSTCLVRRALGAARAIKSVSAVRSWALPSSFQFILISATSVLSVEFGVLALGGLGLYEDAASLRVAQSASQLLLFPLFLNNIVLAPLMPGLVASHAIEVVEKKVLRHTKITFRASFLIWLPLFIFADELVSIAFGLEYAEHAVPALRVLALGYLCNVFLGPASLVLTMTGHEKHAFSGQVVTLFVSVLLVVVLVSNFGATGAGIGIALGGVSGRLYLRSKCIRAVGLNPALL